MRTVYGGLAVVGQQPVAIEVVDVVDALFSEFVPGGTQGGAAGAMALALGWKQRVGPWCSALLLCHWGGFTGWWWDHQDARVRASSRAGLVVRFGSAARLV